MIRMTADTKLTDYLPLPRSLMGMGLSSASVLLYGLLLDRGSLSQKNGYTDFAGWIYVVYTLEELAKELSVSTRMVKRYTVALEEKGLIRKIRHPRTRANRYFLYIPEESVMGTDGGQICHGNGTKGVRSGGHRRPANNQKEQLNSNDLYQYQEDESL